MSTDEDRWQRLIQGLRQGDRQVLQEFCDQYGASLRRLAERHMAEGVGRRFSPDSVVQSVYQTFFRRAQEGQFRLADRASLWNLLSAITLNKVRLKTRFHLRQKRGLDQEVHHSTLGGGDSGEDLDPAASGPSPAEAAEFADQYQQLLASLEEEERQVVELKLQDHTNDEVADRLGISERTVRRLLKRVKAAFIRTFDDP